MIFLESAISPQPSTISHLLLAMYHQPSSISHQPSVIILALFILWWVHIKSLLVPVQITKYSKINRLGPWLKEFSVFSVQIPKNFKIELPWTLVENFFRFFSKNSKIFQNLTTSDWKLHGSVTDLQHSYRVCVVLSLNVHTLVAELQH